MSDAGLDNSSSSIPKLLPWLGGAAIGLVVGVLVTVAGYTLAGTTGGDSRLPDAMKKCGGGNGIELGDNGHTLTFDTKGEEDMTGASYDTFDCFSTELEMPDSVSGRIAQTTSIDGRQTGEWDGIEFSWSYHPDRGLDGVFEIAEDQ